MDSTDDDTIPLEVRRPAPVCPAPAAPAAQPAATSMETDTSSEDSDPGLISSAGRGGPPRRSGRGNNDAVKR